MDKIIFVSAFRDIDRDKWTHYTRTVDTYISRFINIAQTIDYRLVVYLEPHVRDKILYQIGTRMNVEYRDIDEIDTFYNKYLSREREIINSPEYRSHIPFSRKNNPEHKYAEYTLINHSKINFVSATKTLYPKYEFYSWIDFGCIDDSCKDMPKNIDIRKLQRKISFLALEPTIPSILDPIQMLSNETVYIAGSQFIIHNGLVEQYETLYENKIIEWQTKNIADDDQNLVVQIYNDSTELFALYYCPEWFSLYRKFFNSAAIQCRNDYHKLLQALNLENKYIEIGVARGNYSEYLLENTNVKTLYLIDPYKNFEQNDYIDAMNYYDMEYEYNYCKTRLEKYKDRAHFVRKTSIDAVSTFEDESIDFVYIDGNHEYSYVLWDLEAYWKKVKVGGILAGDDYYGINDTKNKIICWDNMPLEYSRSYGIYGVGNALRDFANKYGLKYTIFENQFLIFKV